MMGWHLISNSTWVCAICGVLALGNQELPKRKMSNLLIILQINDFVLLSLFLRLMFPSYCARLPDPVIVGYGPDMLQHSIVQFSEY